MGLHVAVILLQRDRRRQAKLSGVFRIRRERGGGTHHYCPWFFYFFFLFGYWLCCLLSQKLFFLPFYLLLFGLKTELLCTINSSSGFFCSYLPCECAPVWRQMDHLPALWLCGRPGFGKVKESWELWEGWGGKSSLKL